MFEDTTVIFKGRVPRERLPADAAVNYIFDRRQPGRVAYTVYDPTDPAAVAFASGQVRDRLGVATGRVPRVLSAETFLKREMGVLQGVFGEVPIVGGDQSGILWDAPLRIAAVTQRLGRKVAHFIPDTDRARPDSVLQAEMAVIQLGATVSNKGTTLSGGAPWPVMAGFAELFSKPGSVTPFTPQWWGERGVNLARLAVSWREGHPTQTHEAFYRRYTGVPGYRAVVWREDKPASQLPVRVVLADLLREVDGYYRRLARAVPLKDRRGVRRSGEKLLLEIKLWASRNPQGSLGDLWRHLVAWKAEALGVEKDLLLASTSTRHFVFTPGTARQSRFWVLEQFLGSSREIWTAAYDAAVAAGGEALTTDQLAPGGGALPFDVTIKGLGKGTLVVDGGHIRALSPAGKLIVDLDTRVPVVSAAQLAEFFSGYGEGAVAVDGKARLLLFQVLRESILMIPELGSMYTEEVKGMIAELERRGIRVALYPVLRVGLRGWYSAPEDIWLRLPSWLQPVLEWGGLRWISGADLALCWRTWVEAAQAELEMIGRLEKSPALLEHLAEKDPRRWGAKLRRWSKAQQFLRRTGEKIGQLKGALGALRREQKDWRRRAAKVAQESGRIRRRIQPLLQSQYEGKYEGKELTAAQRAQLEEAQARREKLQAQVESFYARAETYDSAAEKLEERIAKLELRRGSRRRLLAEIQLQAELWRLDRLRQLAMVAALEYSDRRPVTAWVELDGSGAWLRRLVETAEFRLEWLSGWTFDADGNEVRVEDLFF